ncbi:hypothetical protein IJZ97_06555 [bacterium]|nr:hypothetical protein [bacterium]
MTRDEHKGIVNRLLGMVAADNQATASELLTQLTDDYEQTLTASEGFEANVKTLTENNETLRAVNAKLFLRVGESDPTKKKPDEPGKGGNDGDDKKLTFDALFNEKGELI